MLNINKKQIRITTKQKVGLILFGIFLTLVILELGLRVGGFVLSSYQRTSNKKSFDADYRILCLGESTTADIYGPKNSWPAQLEIILNNKTSEIKFKIFNEGIGGTNTAIILSRLNENLEKYNPNMVITMMGINDGDMSLVYKESIKNKIFLMFQDFRVYKLSKLIFDSFKSKIKTNKKFNNTNYNIDKFHKTDEVFSEKTDKNPDNEEFYWTLGSLYFNRGRLDEAEEVLMKGLKTVTSEWGCAWTLGTHSVLGWILLKNLLNTKIASLICTLKM